MFQKEVADQDLLLISACSGRASANAKGSGRSVLLRSAAWKAEMSGRPGRLVVTAITWTKRVVFGFFKRCSSGRSLNSYVPSFSGTKRASAGMANLQPMIAVCAAAIAIVGMDEIARVGMLCDTITSHGAV